MPTPAEFLKSLGESLARFDRPRVARLGCFTGLGFLALAAVAGYAGALPASPFFPNFFRILMGSLFGGILLVFLVFAALEGAAERGAERKLREYVAGGGADLGTLLEMARARQGRFPGSERIVAILERLRGGK